MLGIKKISLLKIIAMIVVITFTTTTLAWSAPQVPQIGADGTTQISTDKTCPISIPEELGYIDEFYFPIVGAAPRGRPQCTRTVHSPQVNGPAQGPAPTDSDKICFLDVLYLQE